ncbi:MAG: tetratricopeptide repeat protein [Oculatellaceae cyanobacterium Prado106]|jgi:tetratricopeptide (TPR) repeat protein|nr:tetratricopeptide repeat protein [Oculatellaceae cyanobacterium Prado106]
MKFLRVHRGLFLGLLLALPFLNAQPAKAFLALPDAAYSAMTSSLYLPEPESYAPPLQQAIALLAQSNYAAADAQLKSLIQANPTDMPARDFYYLSQLLQDNWLTLAQENADRAYLNLPSLRLPDPRQGITPSISIPAILQEKVEQIEWGRVPDLGGAIAQTRQQLAQTPDAIQPRLTLAALYLLEGRQPGYSENPAKIQQADDQLRELVRRHPTDAQAWLILANRLPNSAEKTAAYQASTRLNPQLVYAWIGAANDVLANQQSFDQVVLPMLEKGVQANPDQFLMQYAIGELLSAQQRPDDAIAHLDRATRLRPDFPPAWYALFVALKGSSRDRTSELLDSFQRVVVADPTFTFFDVSELNRRMVRADRIPEVVAAYNRISRTNPKLASQGFLQLGFLLTEVAPSRSNRIIRLNRRAYSLDPNPSTLRQLASTLIRNGQPVEGEALLRQFMSEEPPETAIYARGELAFAMAQQDVNRALKYLDEIYAIDPKSTGYEWVGSWLMEQQRLEEAKVFYNRAIRIDPWYNLFLAQILAKQGQTEEAIAKVRIVLDRLPKTDPNYYGFPLVVLSDILAQTGRLEEAIARYEEATVSTDNVYTIYAYGELLQRYQRWDQAIAQYQRVAKIAAEQQDQLLAAKSRRGIGQALVGKGQFSAAKVELEKARSQFQDIAYIDSAAEIAREIQALPR